jgi:hypothetical protein
MKRVLMGTVVAVLAAMCAERSPAADIGFRGIEIRGGLTTASDWDEGVVAGVGVDLGTLWRGLTLHPLLKYAKASRDEDFFGVDIGLDVTDLAAGAEVRWYPSRQERGFFVGGGPMFHQIEYEQTVGSFKVTTDLERLGAAGVAGYRWSSPSGFALSVEARYDTVDVFDRAEALVALRFGGSR